MNARTLNTTLIAALLGASGTAFAGPGHSDGFTTRVKVLASTPVYETINEPRRECWVETVGYETRDVRSGGNTGGTLIGAIAGGLLGSAVGKGDGRVAAAAVGAATGAVVGNRWNDRDGRYAAQPQQVERCRTHDDFRQVISGYDVRYRFQDREYTTYLPYDPGNWINLDVRFSVVEDTRPGRFHSSGNTWRN